MLLKQRFGPPIQDFLGVLCSCLKGSLREALTVFLYHDVSDAPSEFSKTYDLNVPPALFDRQLRFIKKHFNVISPDDLIAGCLPERAAMVTFDDGFRGYFETAVEILETHGLPSIIFLNMGPVRGQMFWSGLITYLCDQRKDFREYIGRSISAEDVQGPLFLSCRPSVVAAYVNGCEHDLEGDVHAFVGKFATEEQLAKATANPLVFFGNHSYDHYVLRLLSDEELSETYGKNSTELERYSNYREEMVSLPFGQPGTCFSGHQVSLLLSTGVKRVFRSSGSINWDGASQYLDRIALTARDTSSSKMWYRVFRGQLRDPSAALVRGLASLRSGAG